MNINSQKSAEKLTKMKKFKAINFYMMIMP